MRKLSRHGGHDVRYNENPSFQDEMNKETIRHLVVENFGQIKKADVEFGDLTVVVGPQATGKSIFLQLLNGLVDKAYIHSEMKRFGIDWQQDSARFFNVFFGEGMQSLSNENSIMKIDGKKTSFDTLYRRSNGKKEETFFSIPAQRVLTLRDGWPRPFTDFSPGDPFLVRRFSEQLRLLMENEFATQTAALFPQPNRLKKEFREVLSRAVFHDFDLLVDTSRIQKRLVMKPKGKDSSLPFMVWSAGQREFIPLLMGLYWLLPPSRVSTRDAIQWVAIEEPEMGLHPQAISATLLLVMELLKRGYRVCLSTHSTDVLDVVWAIRTIQRYREINGARSKREQDHFLRLFGLPQNNALRDFSSEVLEKTMKVYFFNGETGCTEDISSLDPGDETEGISSWGGLTNYCSRAGEVVADVVANAGKEKK